jgi:hypothetical protein
MYMQGFPYTLNSITVSAPVDVAVTIAQNRIDAELANQIMLADVLKNGGVTGDEPETKSYTPWLPVKPRVQQTHHRWFEEHTDGWAVIVFMENFGPQDGRGLRLAAFFVPRSDGWRAIFGRPNASSTIRCQHQQMQEADMAHLSKLAFKTVQRTGPQRDPVVERREKLAAAIDEQMLVHAARLKGEDYTVERSKWQTNEQGERVEVKTQRRINPWFFEQDGAGMCSAGMAHAWFL